MLTLVTSDDWYSDANHFECVSVSFLCHVVYIVLGEGKKKPLLRLARCFETCCKKSLTWQKKIMKNAHSITLWFHGIGWAKVTRKHSVSTHHVFFFFFATLEESNSQRKTDFYNLKCIEPFVTYQCICSLTWWLPAERLDVQSAPSGGWLLGSQTGSSLRQKEKKKKKRLLFKHCSLWGSNRCH